MGNGRWNAQSWAQYAQHNVHNQTRSQIFSTRTLLNKYNPAMIKMRESRSSADNPHPTPIILASDVTGSMGMIAEQLMRDGLNTLAQEIYDRKPISDPHIMIMAVGDAKTDCAPLQVTQFEADIRVAEQARELWLESGGGGNGGESYCAAHLFAAMKTATDAAEKENRKGFLFTIGDEPVHDGMTRQEVESVLGIKTERDLTGKECVALAQRNWEVFHIVLTNEGFCQSNPDAVLSSWQKLLPERTIKLSDVNRLAETIISLIQVNRGADPHVVANSWSGSTAMVVSDALRSYGTPATTSRGSGLRRMFGL